MKYSNKKLVFFIIVAFIATFTATAQLSKEHWIPPVHPIKEGATSLIGTQKQFLYLSTPEAAAFQVTITDGAGTPIAGSPFTISNANPINISLGAIAGSLVTTEVADLNRPIATNRGLILTGNKEYYANLRFADGSQAGNISSKGRLGIGTEFRLGSFPQGRTRTASNGFFASVMATEDNTVVTFDDYNTNVVFTDNTGLESIVNDVITTTLNAGESYVVAGRYNIQDNLEGFIGARVSSNKPIAVNTGSMLGNSTTAGGQDMGIDQIVPANLVGTEYITIRGNGTDAMENVLVVATANNTAIFVNGQAQAIANINAGEHVVIRGDQYIGVGHKNMFVETSEPTYVYQILGGDDISRTQGMSFIPPLSCNLLNTIDLIPDVDKIDNITYIGGGILVTTRIGATLTINGDTVTQTPEAVTGNSDWETYRITGITGNVKIESTEAISVGLFGANDAAGFAGFYSSFGIASQTTDEINTCISDASFDALSRLTSVSPGTPGTWMPEFDSTTDLFDPQVDPPGVYIFTLDDCSQAEIKVTITVDGSSISNSKLPVCDLDSDQDNASLDGIATFDLTAANETLTTEDTTGFTFEFYESQIDIDTNNPIVNPTSYRNTIPFNQILLTEITTPNGCPVIVELALEVFETIRSQNMGYVHYACDDDTRDNVLEGFFDLEEIRAILFTGVNSTFYTSQTDAENEINPISGTDYFSADATIYAAIQDVNKCRFVTTFDLVVLQPPSVLNQPEFEFCMGETQVSIEAPLGNDFYNWFLIHENGTEELVSTDRELITSVEGFYRLFVENEFSSDTQFFVCQNESLFELIISEPATITSVEVIDFFSNNSITVLAEGIGDYEYALNNGTFQDSNIFTDVLPDTYTVRVRDKKGCGEVTEGVIVRGFPNFFTPNGDGIHEFWTANDIPLELRGSPVNIFDRYGKLLFQFPLGQSGWGGTYTGNLMPSSDYWYTATLNDGRFVKGHFTLKR